MSTKKPLKSG